MHAVHGYCLDIVAIREWDREGNIHGAKELCTTGSRLSLCCGYRHHAKCHFCPISRATELNPNRWRARVFILHDVEVQKGELSVN